MPFGKAHDLIQVRSSPSVDALSVIANSHNLVVGCNAVDNPCLQRVDVLIFVHKQVGKPRLIVTGSLLIILQNLKPIDQQIVIVGQSSLKFGFLVMPGE